MSLQAIQEAYQRGDLAEVRRLVGEALLKDQHNEQLWVIKMMTAEHAFEREAAMQRVLALNPNNPQALQFKQQMGAGQASPGQGAAPQKSPMRGVPGKAGEEVLGTYEMLWDCEYCGTKKLLGHTHRFCPHCGAQQNPDKRYFPSDDEKVAVKDHVYYGVDVTCAACQTLNSANSDFCTNCGSPLSDAKKAEVLAEQRRKEGEKFEAGQGRDLTKEKFEQQQARIQPKKGMSTRTKLILGALVGLLVVCIGIGAFVIFGSSEKGVYVEGHSWRREIQIQDFQARSQGDWCDSMPSDAYNISQSEKQRSTRQVPDGEECTVRRVDNGDGTFREVRECRTKYRSEPVYDDWCDYRVNRWDYARSVVAEGDSLSDVPAWPQFTLSKTGTDLGAEREGDRKQVYVVRFKDSESGKTYDCEFTDENKWRSFPLESTWILEVGVLGDARCDSLKPQSGG
jgi:hypothetical protein